MDEKKELRPCPFCGSRNIKFDPCTLRVRCGDCRATSGLITRFIREGITEQAAAREAWNTRT